MNPDGRGDGLAASLKKAIFVDRDDTLIRDVPYNGDPDTVELMPGAREACQALKKLGFEIFIISNQSGVGRGIITRQQVERVNQRVLELVGDSIFSGIYCCFDAPDVPDEGCRKPSPKMILTAAREHHLDLCKSIMIGDKLTDVQAGKKAGCLAICFDWQSKVKDNCKGEADFIAANWQQALDWIKTVNPL